MSAQPVITGVPASETTTGAIQPFATVVVTDSSALLTETATVQLAESGNFSLGLPSSGTYNAATGTYTVSGSLAAVQAALRGLVFSPNPAAAGAVTGVALTVADGSASVLATTGIAVVNPAVTPVINGLGPVITTDHEPVLPFVGTTIADPNASQSETLDVLLSTTANGAFSDPLGEIVGTTGAWSITGSPAMVQAGLQQLEFTPLTGQAPLGGTTVTGVALSFSDGQADASAGTTITAIADTQLAESALASLKGKGSPTIIASGAGGAFPAAISGAIDIAALAPDPGSSSFLPSGYQAELLYGIGAATLANGGSLGALLVGDAGPDLLTGGGGANTLIGGAGIDTLVGAGTSDLLVSNFSADIALGPGADTVFAGPGAQTITAGAGTGMIFLGSGSAMVTATGADTIIAGAGSASITAPQGNVEVFGGGAPISFLAGGGTGTVIAGAGANTVFASAATGNTMFFGGPAAGNTMFAGVGGSTMIGGSGAGMFVGGSGNALVFGDASHGTILGGSGAGIFIAGVNGSQITAGSGNSTVVAGNSSTVSLVGGGNDLVVAGPGALMVSAAQSTGKDQFFLGPGNNTVTGSASQDTIVGGSGSAVISGGNAGNVYVFFAGDAGGTDTIENFVPGRDLLALYGYGANGVASSTVAQGTTTLGLTDGTHIVFAGVTGLPYSPS